jgi:hypothetical protein
MRPRFVLDLFARLKFNTGRDLTATFTLNGVVIKQFGLHKSTKITPKFTIESETPSNLGGITIQKAIPMGFDVDVAVTRQNGVVDDILQFILDTYFAGNPDIVVTMMQTVKNDDVTVNQYNYVDGNIWVDDVGDYPGVAKVSQSVKMFFARRLAVTTNAPVTIGGALIPSLAGSL